MPSFKMPSPRFEMRLAPETVNNDKRTVDMIFYDGEEVPRFSWSKGSYNLAFSMDPGHIRMDRLASGRAPLLDSHDDGSLSSVLGVIENASIQNGKGTASARFAVNDPASDAVWNKVEQHILRNVSMGARVHKMQDVSKKSAEVGSYLAVDWEPMEISMVPMGAASRASIQFSANPGHEIEVELLRAEPSQPDALLIANWTLRGREIEVLRLR